MGLQAEALSFERDRATAGERVEDRRRVAARRLQDLGVRLGEQLLVADVLPHDEPLDDVVQPLALSALHLLGREPIGMRRRVVDELREQHRAGAASGRRAHHRCSVEGWPWRIDFSRADSRLIVSSGSATSISLRFGAPTASSFASVVIGSERLLALRPRRVPVAAVAGRVEVAERRSGRTGSRGSGPRRARGRAGRRGRARGGSAATLLSAVSTSLWVTKKSSAPAMRALTSIRIGSSPSRAGEDVEAGVVERLLDRDAPERALGGEDPLDAAALDVLGLDGVHRRVVRDLGLHRG